MDLKTLTERNNYGWLSVDAITAPDRGLFLTTDTPVLWWTNCHAPELYRGFIVLILKTKNRTFPSDLSTIIGLSMKICHTFFTRGLKSISLYLYYILIRIQQEINSFDKKCRYIISYRVKCYHYNTIAHILIFFLWFFTTVAIFT